MPASARAENAPQEKTLSVSLLVLLHGKAPNFISLSLCSHQRGHMVSDMNNNVPILSEAFQRIPGFSDACFG